MKWKLYWLVVVFVVVSTGLTVTAQEGAGGADARAVPSVRPRTDRGPDARGPTGASVAGADRRHGDERIVPGDPLRPRRIPDLGGHAALYSRSGLAVGGEPCRAVRA